MNKTGQGQIIEAESLTQDKDGNWIPATPEPYYPTLFEKFCCFIGYHYWSYEMERIGDTLYLPKSMPDNAECIKCGKTYGKQR